MVSIVGKLSLLFSYFLLLHISEFLTNAKVVEGDIDGKQDWVFLDRFCFLSDLGRLKFEVEFPELYRGQSLLLYYDDQWPRVYPGTDMKCLEREAVLKPENNQVINLTESYAWAGCNFEPETNQVVCQGGRTFRSYRERWWFLVVSNCANTAGVKFKYKLTMTNSETNVFFRHFSADEFYILHLDIAFFLVFSVLLGLSSLVAHKLQQKDLFHTTFKMYLFSIVFQVVCVLFNLAHYGQYSVDGKGSRACRYIGRISEVISVLTFILLLILLGKGYTITRGRLRQSTTIKITIFMCIYTIAYASVFIWEATDFDPGKVLYTYQSPGGYVLIGFRFLAWLWFNYAIFFTLKNYPEKRVFYYPLYIVYTIWFAAGPVVILVANFALEPWKREKIAHGIELAIAFFGFTFFVVLTRPSAANKNFPYHVRVSKIGIMAVKSPEEATNFDHDRTGGHNMFDASYTPDFTDLFIVERPQVRENPTVNDMFSAAKRPKTQENMNIEAFPHQLDTGFPEKAEDKESNP